MGNSTHFFGFGTISTARDPRYTKIGTSSKLVDFVISGCFLGYSTQFLTLETISTARDPWYTKIGTSSKLVDLVISGCFRDRKSVV